MITTWNGSSSVPIIRAKNTFRSRESIRAKA